MTDGLVLDPYVIRAFTEDDRNFILATWMRSLRAAPCYRFIPSNAFYSRLESVIWRILASHDVRVACFKDEPAHIVGWVCGTKHFLDFIYVKRHSRRCGLTARLIDDLGLTAPIRCTFWTASAERFIPLWQYKPSLLEWG